MFRKKIITYLLLLSICFNQILPIYAETNFQYCDYSKLFVGDDKYENFNRKVFNLNKKC